MPKEEEGAEGVVLVVDPTPILVPIIIPTHLGVPFIETLALEIIAVIIQDRLAIEVFLDFPPTISAFHMAATPIIIRTDYFTPPMVFTII
jgi:hypothetical protein